MKMISKPYYAITETYELVHTTQCTEFREGSDIYCA